VPRHQRKTAIDSSRWGFQQFRLQTSGLLIYLRTPSKLGFLQLRPRLQESSHHSGLLPIQNCCSLESRQQDSFISQDSYQLRIPTTQTPVLRTPRKVRNPSSWGFLLLRLQSLRTPLITQNSFNLMTFINYHAARNSSSSELMQTRTIPVFLGHLHFRNETFEDC